MDELFWSPDKKANNKDLRVSIFRQLVDQFLVTQTSHVHSIWKTTSSRINKLYLMAHETKISI